MAIEDVLLLNLGAFNGFLMRSVERWTKAAMDARAPGYTMVDLFGTLREQFVANWDTVSELTRFPGYPTVPTVTIQARFGSLNGKNGTVFVRQRLTGLVAADFRASDVVQFGNAANKISGSDVEVSLPAPPPPGNGDFDFDGQAIVTLRDDAPAAGIYRGLIMVSAPSGATFEPLTWVVVVADP